MTEAGLKDLRKPRRELIMISSILLMVIIVGWVVYALFNKIADGPPQVPSPIEATITAIVGRHPTLSTQVIPGLIVYGRVQDQNGVGIENVQIYRSYSSYPGEAIATTDASGYYISDFYGIPGDEMVTIRAEKSGIVFEPEYYYWRHYYGYEQVEYNFTARP